MVTFRVDDVVPAAVALPTQPLVDLAADALVFGQDPATRVVEPNGVHPLLDAIGRAFADHRPLVLSPDAVWLTILDGVARHIRLHAEESRARFVDHTGRARLTVDVSGPMPRDAESWRQVVAQLGEQLAASAGGTELFECDFSTSTDIERTAARVVLLDAYSPYFSFWLTFICGIPSITLSGTVEDWRGIRARVDELPGLGLTTWHRSLAPITDQFARAAAGAVDTAFWQRIYSPVDAYGGQVVTGWAARLYPYLKSDGEVSMPNPLLALPIGEPRDVPPAEDGFYRGPGIRTDSVPATLSKVIANVNDRVDHENLTVALHAGLVGVAQDDDGALRPIAGWHLAPARLDIDVVADRIIRDHGATPPEPISLPDMATAEVLALYHRLGSATLFDGAWRLRPMAEHGQVKRYPLLSLRPMIDLADGRCVAAVPHHGGQEFHWLVCRVEEVDGALRLADDPAEVPVLGTSLALVLAAALDADGDITHLETERLADLDRRLRGE